MCSIHLKWLTLPTSSLGSSLENLTAVPYVKSLWMKAFLDIDRSISPRFRILYKCRLLSETSYNSLGRHDHSSKFTRPYPSPDPLPIAIIMDRGAGPLPGWGAGCRLPLISDHTFPGPFLTDHFLLWHFCHRASLRSIERPMDCCPINVVLSKEHFILSQAKSTLWCDRRDGKLTAGTGKLYGSLICQTLLELV